MRSKNEKIYEIAGLKDDSGNEENIDQILTETYFKQAQSGQTAQTDKKEAQEIITKHEILLSTKKDLNDLLEFMNLRVLPDFTD